MKNNLQNLRIHLHKDCFNNTQESSVLKIDSAILENHLHRDFEKFVFPCGNIAQDAV